MSPTPMSKSKMNGHGRQHSFEDQPGDESVSSNTKRKSEDGSPATIRGKRNRYVSIACSECKRRKIKCNGETPCQRCGNLSLECLYVPNCCSGGFKETEDFRQMNEHIHSLQEQVNNLYNSLNALHERHDGGFVPIPQSTPSEPYSRHVSLVSSNPPVHFSSNPISSPNPTARVTRFQGPTSSAFNFEVANSSLQTMGITTPDYAGDNDISTHDGTPGASPRRNQITLPPIHPSKDPLWSVGREEAVRLAKVYDEEVGVMYPMLDIEKCLSKIHVLFNFMESAVRTGLVSRVIAGADSLQDEDTNIVKMVLATALVIEGCGRSELGQKLFESVKSVCGELLWQPVLVKGLMLLVITAQYLFQIDEESQAYRITGIAARMAFEMGLHRREVLTRASAPEYDNSWMIRLFWSIYVLDRRWSFGTGLPFAIQDDDIDPGLPKPDVGTPYLTAMAHYGHLSSKAWRSIAAYEETGDEVRKDKIEYIDYKIKQWHTAIPEHLQFNPANKTPAPDSTSRTLRRLQVMLYLRANQLRILIYRPVLHSATSIMENRDHAQTVVEVAKDTIRVLTRLNQTTDIYRTQQVCFNYFLISALAVLFLSVAHAPVEFSRQVRDEFYMALDLVKGFSSKSYTSKRLWKTIRGLKEVGPRLGLVARHSTADNEDAHSSAAMAMAGLAGHQLDKANALHVHLTPTSLGSSPMNGHQMTYELTNLFEAAGGIHNMMPSSGRGPDGMNGFVGPHDMGEGMSGTFGNEEEFARIMRELF